MPPESGVKLRAMVRFSFRGVVTDRVLPPGCNGAFSCETWYRQVSVILRVLDTDPMSPAEALAADDDVWFCSVDARSRWGVSQTPASLPARTIARQVRYPL